MFTSSIDSSLSSRGQVVSINVYGFKMLFECVPLVAGNDINEIENLAL
jgi:hypothetical protein